MSASGSSPHILRRLSVVEDHVRAAVERLRRTDPDPDDPFRGIYVSEEHVDRLLGIDRLMTQASIDGTAVEDTEAHAGALEFEGDDVRLRRLWRAFALDEIDIDLLLIAMAPDLDRRFEKLYGYLNDDVSLRRATVGLALGLCGLSPTNAQDRARLSAEGALVAGQLIAVEDPERPFLTRSLRVPDRVTAHLLEGDTPDPLVAAMEIEPLPVNGSGVLRILQGFESGSPLVYLRDRGRGGSRNAAVEALRRVGKNSFVLDLSLAGPEGLTAERMAAAGREAGLRDAVLVAGPVDAVLDTARQVVTGLTLRTRLVVLTGARPWDPAWSNVSPFVAEIPEASPSERVDMWQAVLDGSSPPRGEILAATSAFRLSPDQIDRACRMARSRAAGEHRPVESADLRDGARAQNSSQLERLARRIQSDVDWSHLILNEDAVELLHEIATRVRHRDTVFERWGMATGSRRRGVSALFAGPPGTGKTLAAEVLANELGLDLYTIDLATVVDKYVGETEKNLDRIFREAEDVNGILFFDEADAVFGKRSAVTDARDRYANIEIAYLLQRMEYFDGLAVLATNLRANLDDAFTRRLDVVVDFVAPDVLQRALLWELHLPPSVPRARDVDVGQLARAENLTGGEIRNIAVGAAFAASARGRKVSMQDLLAAASREYRKLGLLYPTGPGFLEPATDESTADKTAAVIKG